MHIRPSKSSISTRFRFGLFLHGSRFPRVSLEFEGCVHLPMPDVNLCAYTDGPGHKVNQYVFAMLLSFQQEISDVGQCAINRWKTHLLCR